jgi:hypothetical protein
VSGVRNTGTSITLPPIATGGRPLKEAAELIAGEARRISGKWSTRIPGSIKVSVASDGSSATITAGGPSAPAAYPAEGRSNGRPVNHPVYGRADRSRRQWGWAPWSPPRPFMVQALDATIDKAANKWADELIRAWTSRR